MKLDAKAWICGGLVVAAQVALAKPPAIKDFPDLVARVSPAVVNIQATKIVKNASLEGYLSTLSGPDAKGLESTQSSLGSGFVVASSHKSESTEAGDLRSVLILTNEHVVAAADEIEIMTSGQRGRYLATIVARDPQTDIAVLKARLPATIEPLRLGDSAQLRVGETVFAIGNPFGLGHTVTSGILSAKDRSLGIGRADRYLQTDAPINFGNSGGPLFNLKGEVIGINTLIRADAHGIGFAIPSNTVKQVLPALETAGKVERAWIGVVAANESTALRRRFQIMGPIQDGVIITNLVKDAPAHKVGLREGDLVSSLESGGKAWPIATVWNLRDALDALKPGAEIELRVQRGEKQFLGRMKLEAMPEEKRLPEGHDYY